MGLGPNGPPWALVGRALVGPLGPYGPGHCGPGPYGPPGRLYMYIEAGAYTLDLFDLLRAMFFHPFVFKIELMSYCHIVFMYMQTSI